MFRTQCIRSTGALALAVVLTTSVATVPGIASGQTAVTPAVSGNMPEASPADVETLDAIVHALYNVISGPPGPRNWQRFRTLFAPGARLIPARPDSTGHSRIMPMTVEEFVTAATQAFQRDSFYEDEIGRSTDTFGAVTQVFTAYASRRTPHGKPFERGINSMQFFFDGKRWYCVTIYWDSERPGLAIPEKYLAKH